MRVCFGHVWDLLFYIVTQYYLLESEVYSGSNWEVAQDEPIWYSSVFMQHDEIGQSLALAQPHEILHDIAAPINSLAVGYEYSHFLQELEQPAGWIPGGGDEYLWIRIQHILILIINMSSRDKSIEIIRLQLFLQFLFFCVELGWQFGFSGLRMQELQFLVMLLFEQGFGLEGVQVLTALADVLAQHWCQQYDC